MVCVALSASPASAASRNCRTDVFSSDLTALLRWRAFSFCLLRLIWDLIFATRMPRQVCLGGPVVPGTSRVGHRAPCVTQRGQTRACRQPETKDSRDRREGSN